MDRVEFITIQNDDDLILSFSFDEQAEFGVEGFIIHRCPKYEFALMPHERGPSIAWTEDDEIITVKEIKLTRETVFIKTDYEQYLFDTSQLSDEETKAAIEILKKMNYDKVFKFSYS
jgi:hypothetical protein